MKGFKGARVFVSGGAGVIGRRLVERLHAQGAILFVGDLQPMPKAWSTEIRYRHGDLNTIAMQELEAFAPEYYFHLAATFERTEETPGFWQENFHHNILLSHHLLQCFKDVSSLKKTVFASSYLIYNPTLYLTEAPMEAAMDLRESEVRSPRNLCGTAKLLHEQELASAQLDAVCARIFRSYGKGSRDVISRWVRALLAKEPLHVFRTEGMFDFIFADDVAEGLMRLALSKASGTVNLGTGTAHSIANVLEILKSHFPTMRTVQKPSKIPYEASQADMKEFQSITGWLPGTSLEQGIAEIVAYESG